MFENTDSVTGQEEVAGPVLSQEGLEAAQGFREQREAIGCLGGDSWVQRPPPWKPRGPGQVRVVLGSYGKKAGSKGAPAREFGLGLTAAGQPPKLV